LILIKLQNPAMENSFGWNLEKCEHVWSVVWLWEKRNEGSTCVCTIVQLWVEVRREF